MGTLLEVKLHLPESSRDTVERPRLLEYLNAGLSARLTLICAPAGSGKTTIAADWLQSLLAQGEADGETVRAAWYTIDEHDNDLPSFTSYVAGTIRRSCPRLLSEWIDLHRRVSIPEPEEVAAELIAGLASAAGPLLLALDDYHFVTDPAIHRYMAYFVRHLPDFVHLVITARYEPPIGLLQLRAQRQIVELRSVELAFTLEEARGFLRNAVGEDLGAAAVGTLWQQTEGWVVGLRLAAISLQMSHDRQQFVRHFAQTTTRHVADYLVDQVLATQPESVHDFLLQSSILVRLSRTLCAAVVAQHQYGDVPILDYLEHNNLFLIPLDDFGEWYRYHSQFRSMLHRRLTSQYTAGEVAVLHRRAARWLADHGHTEDAVGHYVAAGEAETAAVLVERLIPDLLRREQWHQSGRYLALLPAETILQSPALLLLQAWICTQDYNLAQIRRLVGQAESLLRSRGGRPEDAGSAAIWGQIYALRTRASIGRAPWEEALAYGQDALRLLPPCHVWARTFTYSALVVVVLALEGYEAAHRMMGAELAANSGQRTEYVARLYHVLGLLYYYAGRMDEFGTACEPYGRLASALDMPDGIQSAQTMAGVLHLERGNLQTAYGLLTEVMRRPDLTHIVALRAAAYPLLEMYAEQGLAAEGNALLVVLQQRLEKISDPEGAAETEALRAFWAALSGDRSAAEQYLRQVPQDTPFLHLSNRGLIQIRICHILGRPADLEQATDLAQRLVDAAGKHHHTHVEVIALALLAQTYWLRDLPVQALAALRQAINLGYGRGFRRTLCTPGRVMGPMLYRLAAEPAFAAPASYLLGEIVRLAEPQGCTLPDAAGGSADTGPDQKAFEPLSTRESEVLSLLACGMTNQAIAERLHVSRYTVRHHTTNIYRKWGVENRHEVLERAHLWGLLPDVVVKR